MPTVLAMVTTCAGLVEELARNCCLPAILLERVKNKLGGMKHVACMICETATLQVEHMTRFSMFNVAEDWVQFCAQQMHLQMLLGGK